MATGEYDLRRWAEKLAEAVRQGVQIERHWLKKLEDDQKKKEADKPS